MAALLLIPHLIGATHIKKKKCSTAEVRDSFILQIDDATQLKEARKKVRDKHKDLHMTVQPYIIVAGSFENITNRYIIVNDITYELPTITRAVDTCFKIIWALYLEYPSACLPVWQFLQRAIYKIPVKAIDPREKIPASVFGLLSDCGLNEQ